MSTPVLFALGALVAWAVCVAVFAWSGWRSARRENAPWREIESKLRDVPGFGPDGG